MKQKHTTSEDSRLPALQNVTPEPDLPALAAGLVHEVKNPLAAIHLHLQLLQNYMDEVREDGLRTKLQSKISMIQDEILNLNRTLHSFFTILRPETYEEVQSFDLNLLIEKIIHLLEPQAAREGIQIEFQRVSLDSLDRWDPAFIRQIILNLILNSIQAFQNSGIRREARHICVRTDKEEGFICIEIKDNGPGISKEIQEKMFDAFYTTRKKQGSGLGLTLVQRMVRTMGGRLEVDSKTGVGSSFAVFLDTEPRGEQPLLEAPQESDQAG